MNSKYFAMIAFSAAFLSPLTAEAKTHTADMPVKHAQAALTDTQKLEEKRKAEADFNKKADKIIDNLLPYLENQWVEGYYGFIYKDPIYMTTGIGTKFSIGKAKISEAEKAVAKPGDIIVNGEVMLDQIPFRRKSTGKELTYEEKLSYAKKAKATGCGGHFDGYKRHQRLANAQDIILTREDARNVTRAELRYKIKRIRKLILNRYKLDIFEQPMGVQMAFADIAYMAGENGLLKYKNALSQAKAGNYSKLPNYTDCGHGKARNNMRRGIVGLAAYETAPSNKKLNEIKHTFEKYNLDLPIVDQLETQQKLLAQTNRAQEQLKNAQKVAGSLSETLASHTLSPTMALAHALPKKENETVVSVRINDNFPKATDDNIFSAQQGLLNPYDNIAQVYLDKFMTLGQSNAKKPGVSFQKASMMKKYTSRQG